MTERLARLPLSIDPLIKEAKRRMYRRRLLLIAGIAGVVALALGLTFASRPSAAPVAIQIPSHGRVPRGVTTIDVQGAQMSPLRVTDPSQINRIVALFDALDTQRHALKAGVYSSACAGGYAQTVTFTFRNSTGDAVATADSAPVPADPCSAINFVAGPRPAAWLVDRNRASSLIGRVQNLLGIQFRFKLFRG